MAIVESTVGAHDGTIEAVNLPESGANVAIAIPSTKRRSAKAEQISGAGKLS